MGSIVCTFFVHDCIRLFSFVHLLLFFLSQGGGLEDMLSPFSDFGFENGHDRLYFVYLTFFLSQKGGGALVTCYPNFSDFGFENGFNRFYFVCM